jgi:murein DD-endopeptidase MepM/ murein hydrolase activator NlpD
VQNMLCPDQISERDCPACYEPLNINNQCVNCNCYNSNCYEEPESEPEGGGSGSGGGSTPPNENTPCSNSVTGKSNPLVKMELAPPNPNKPLGGTFGKNVRNGKSPNHDGYDFEGEVGTPVYATHNGTIASAPYEVNQPNRINGQYPTGYSGDDNGAGNRIYINIGNNTQVAYFHLQAGTPIATNPRTGQPFGAGDQIYQGEVIGYICVTGNASPNVPHLHYGVRVNNVWVDPLPYINTTKDINHKLSTPCD